MNPIPKEAASVVKTIRRDVPRPEELPIFCIDTLRWVIHHVEYCPMGLHPTSASRIPSCSSNFADGLHSFLAVHAFLNWWDGLTEVNAQEGVDALWPEKGEF